MNVLEQIVRTIAMQREIYLREHCIGPNDLVIRVSVNFRLRDEMRHCNNDYFYVSLQNKDMKETIMGGPLEATRDIPDNIYYLDLMVYNRVQKQLKFTVQEDVPTGC